MQSATPPEKEMTNPFSRQGSNRPASRVVSCSSRGVSSRRPAAISSACVRISATVFTCPGLALPPGFKSHNPLSTGET